MKHDESGNCLVREIGERAFSRNKLLKDFVVPSSVTKLGEWALYYTSMTSLVVHSNVTEIGNYCFLWNSNLTTAEINTVNVRGTNLFSTCGMLNNIKLADVTSIPEAMFISCSSLREFDIPETVTSIESSAFMNTGLRELIIPAGVKSIGSNCFIGCTNLGSIYSLPVVAPSLGTESFGNGMLNYTGVNAANKSLHVPSNATGYESGDWKSVLQDKVKFTVYYV